MRFNLLAVLVLVTGCAPDVADTDTVETVDILDVEELDIDSDPADTAELAEEDPCDLTFRAYAEDGHYVDVTVGAMPLVRFSATHSNVVYQGSDYNGVGFDVTSKQGCGEVDILGVQMNAVRVDGAQMPKTETAPNLLIAHDPREEWNAPSGWYNNTYESAVAPEVGATWDGTYSSAELGEFTSFTLGLNDSRSFFLRPEALRSVPLGDYLVTISVAWQDPKTGTTVSYANLDSAIWHVTVEP